MAVREAGRRKGIRSGWRGAAMALLTLACHSCGSSLQGTWAPGAKGPSPAAPAGEWYPTDGAQGTTYYVRPDGGSAAACTGLVDAAYPGSGEGQPCAWDHPFRALEPSGEPDSVGTVRITGGDRLIIGAGSYRIGFGAPGADSCQTGYPWDCVMPPVPSGPDPAHPTRIVGAGWDRGCPDPPELWGTERAAMILNLAGADNVEIACLEITDRAGCVEQHSGGLACPRESYPYGDWAPWGLYAEDAANVTLRDLDIHGMAHGGIWAGRLRDWTVEDVRLVGNGWVGWDGDIDGTDANAGTLTFRRWTVAWNGCAETYPDREPTGCWGQSAGGYGDGMGTGSTGGDWIIEDAAFLRNTSDGLDLLYHTLGGSVTIRRTIAEGNAGDQIKTAGTAHLENVIAVSDCGFFAGQSFTHEVDHCRAGGSALAISLQAGDRVTVVNATLSGEGDCLVIAECAAGESCDGTESVSLRNTVFVGHPEFAGAGDVTCLTWTDLDDELFSLDYAVINGAKGTPDPCPVESLCGVRPELRNEAIDAFDARLSEGSPAIDAGTEEGAPKGDFAGHPRDSRPDIGAYEWWEPSVRLYLPLVR